MIYCSQTYIEIAYPECDAILHSAATVTVNWADAVYILANWLILYMCVGGSLAAQ